MTVFFEIAEARQRMLAAVDRGDRSEAVNEAKDILWHLAFHRRTSYRGLSMTTAEIRIEAQNILDAGLSNF